MLDSTQLGLKAHWVWARHLLEVPCWESLCVPPTIHSFPCLSPGWWDPPLGAVGCVILTVDAVEARGAGARVTVHAVGAVGTIPAGIAGTFVDVLLTEGTLEARQAVAEGRVDTISAGTPVVTWV